MYVLRSWRDSRWCLVYGVHLERRAVDPHPHLLHSGSLNEPDLDVSRGYTSMVRALTFYQLGPYLSYGYYRRHRRDIKASLGPFSTRSRVGGALMFLLESGLAYIALCVRDFPCWGANERKDKNG